MGAYIKSCRRVKAKKGHQKITGKFDLRGRRFTEACGYCRFFPQLSTDRTRSATIINIVNGKWAHTYTVVM